MFYVFALFFELHAKCTNYTNKYSKTKICIFNTQNTNKYNKTKI